MAIHGNQDDVVLIDQSERIVEVYRKAGLPVEFVVVKDAGHGGDLFFEGEYRERVIAFLQNYLTKPGMKGAP